MQRNRGGIAMKTLFSLLVSLLLAVVSPAGLAAEADAKWNAADGEHIAALKFPGDAKAGKEGYYFCVECHLARGGGRIDGKVPQLAGQLRTVLIKQISDIRTGRRDNASMHPSAKDLADAQEVADVAAYIETLCIPGTHGTYEAPDAVKRMAAGVTLYEKDCVVCHGANGAGDKDKFYPMVAGQHYKYLLRQLTEIRDGKRRNAHPEMIKVVAPYSNDQLVELAAYQASLATPGTVCKGGPPTVKKK